MKSDEVMDGGDSDVVTLLCVLLQSMKSDDLRERLEESEKLMNEMEKTWEDKLKETERIHMVLDVSKFYSQSFTNLLIR